MFNACCCVFKEITLVGSYQRNYFENATACSKCTLNTRVATRLNPCGNARWQSSLRKRINRTHHTSISPIRCGAKKSSHKEAGSEIDKTITTATTTTTATIETVVRSKHQIYRSILKTRKRHEACWIFLV